MILKYFHRYISELPETYFPLNTLLLVTEVLMLVLLQHQYVHFLYFSASFQTLR